MTKCRVAYHWDSECALGPLPAQAWLPERALVVKVYVSPPPLPRRGATGEGIASVAVDVSPPPSYAGELPGRALQVWRWMYADGAWMSNMRDTVGVNSGLSQKFVDKARQVES